VALIDALQFVVLAFAKEDARQAGAIRALLASKGTPIGPYDVLIAGQAVAQPDPRHTTRWNSDASQACGSRIGKHDAGLWL
jgi:predicted nucleic acid-binding protein